MDLMHIAVVSIFCRCENVIMLLTFDGEGKTSYYFGSVTINRNPHFLGPGMPASFA